MKNGMRPDIIQCNVWKPGRQRLIEPPPFSMVTVLLLQKICAAGALSRDRVIAMLCSEPSHPSRSIHSKRFAPPAFPAVNRSPILRDANVSVCFVAMGVGQPSKVTAEELERVDVEIPTAFAKACKASECVRHISLVSSVAADINSKPSRWTGTVAGGGLYLMLKGRVSKATSIVLATTSSFAAKGASIANLLHHHMC